MNVRILVALLLLFPLATVTGCGGKTESTAVSDSATDADIEAYKALLAKGEQDTDNDGHTEE